MRVTPLPDEPFDSWLEAYGRRLGITSAGLLEALGIRGTTKALPDHTIWLHDGEAKQVARVTGIDQARLHAMTLRTFHGRSLQVNPDRRAVVRARWWARGNGSRYCPQCLTERHGRWRLSWRLTWMFACTDHSLLLLDRCPACEHVPRTAVAARGGSQRIAGCPSIATGRHVCGHDLRSAQPIGLTSDSPLLIAQHSLRKLLDSSQPAPRDRRLDPAVFFTDLRVVGAWMLRRSADHWPDLIDGFDRVTSIAGVPSLDDKANADGSRVGRAWRDHRATERSVGQFPPTDAGLVAATAAGALDILLAADEIAVQRIRSLIGTLGHGAIRPPGMPPQHWHRLSEPARGRFLQALDPQLASRDRIRLRTCTPLAHQPTEHCDKTTPARARHIPQMLWPAWTVRMMPKTGFRLEPFRRAMAACLLLPGHPTRQLTGIQTILHPHQPPRIQTTLQALASHGHHVLFQAICHLADHLDRTGSPIDYRRRRQLVTPDLLTGSDWQAICFDAAVHPGRHDHRQRRHKDAQRYLLELLAGADLGDHQHPLAFRSAGDRSAYMTFTAAMAEPLRHALADHASWTLAALGIDEPLTWHPPADACAHLTLPGRDPDDIDTDTVRHLVIDQQMTLGNAAEHLGTSIDHIRLALDHIGPPPQPTPAKATPGWRRGQLAARLLTPAFFDREYIAASKTLGQISRETGYSTPVLSRHARQASIDVIHGRAPTHIDEDWLREQYIERQRSFPDIAAELSVSDMVVIRAAGTYGIQSRPPGVHSRPDLLRKLDPKIPRDIRRAVEGQLHGWLRLHRFSIAMRFPRLNDAGHHLNVDQATLTRQIQRLERDIGTQLYHRGTANRPLLPTTRGSAVLRSLARPDVHAHLCHALTLVPAHYRGTASNPST